MYGRTALDAIIVPTKRTGCERVSKSACDGLSWTRNLEHVWSIFHLRTDEIYSSNSGLGGNLSNMNRILIWLALLAISFTYLKMIYIYFISRYIHVHKSNIKEEKMINPDSTCWAKLIARVGWWIKNSANVSNWK